MKNNLMMNEINKKIMDEIGGVVGKTLSEVMDVFITTIDSLKEDYKLMENNYSKLENNYKKLKDNLKESEEKINSNTEKVEVLESKINILEFDEDGKLQDLKNICKSRVAFLCGNDETNPEYILFYRTLIAHIYNYISNTMHVSRVGKIKIEDFEGSKVLAKNFRPDAKKINKKFNALFKKYDNNTLSKEKSKAVSDILDVMDGQFDVNKIFKGRCA